MGLHRDASPPETSELLIRLVMIDNAGLLARMKWSAENLLSIAREALERISNKWSVLHQIRIGILLVRVDTATFLSLQTFYLTHFFFTTEHVLFFLIVIALRKMFEMIVRRF